VLKCLCIQDQQSVVGIIALTERMQRVEQQPCSRCREAEANAAESITHLSSGLAASLHNVSSTSPCWIASQVYAQ